jgi:hypothetical protein
MQYTGQMKRVFDVISNGDWVSLCQISSITGDEETSVSARLRDFRKKQYGNLEIEKMRVEGTRKYLYRLAPISLVYDPFNFALEPISTKKRWWQFWK